MLSKKFSSILIEIYLTVPTLWIGLTVIDLFGSIAIKLPLLNWYSIFEISIIGGVDWNRTKWYSSIFVFLSITNSSGIKTATLLPMYVLVFVWIFLGILSINLSKLIFSISLSPLITYSQ